MKQVYEDNEKKVESTFTLLIMALNIGEVTSALLLGVTIGEGNLSLYKYGFLILAVSLFIGILVYNLRVGCRKEYEQSKKQCQFLHIGFNFVVYIQAR